MQIKLLQFKKTDWAEIEVNIFLHCYIENFTTNIDFFHYYSIFTAIRHYKKL
jgi:hypothetical protein